MTHPADLLYLQRIANRESPAVILHEPKFLAAQTLFFSVIADLDGTVDFDIADMREVHAVAALGDVNGKRVLDIGCGSMKPYVLTDSFRDLYPPFFAEMLTRLGANVTGIDIRNNPSATYDHRVLDLTKKNWRTTLDAPYDIIACFNLFNAPSSLFEHDAALCESIMNDMHSLLKPDGLLIVTLRDETADPKTSVESKKFELMHLDGNCAWLRPRA